MKPSLFRVYVKGERLFTVTLPQERFEAADLNKLGKGFLALSKKIVPESEGYKVDLIALDNDGEAFFSYE